MLSKFVSAYIYALFIGLMVLALFSAGAFALPVWLLRGDTRWAFQVVVRFFWRLFLTFSPVIGKVTIVNAHYLNKLKPAVYVASHQSSIDFVLLGSMIENFMTISNHPISDLPIFLKSPRLVGVYYMQKGDPNAAITVFNRLSKAVERGINVFIFPEGTRNFTDTLLPFHKGAFRLAYDKGVPVIPVIIDGTGKIVTKGSNVAKTLTRTDIRVIYLEPIYAREGETLRNFIHRVRAKMQQQITENFHV